MSAELFRPNLSDVGLIIELREWEAIEDILATDGEEVDRQALVLVIPFVEFVTPSIIVLEVLKERVMRLRCGCPVREGWTKGVV